MADSAGVGGTILSMAERSERSLLERTTRIWEFATAVGRRGWTSVQRIALNVLGLSVVAVVLYASDADPLTVIGGTALAVFLICLIGAYKAWDAEEVRASVAERERDDAVRAKALEPPPVAQSRLGGIHFDGLSAYGNMGGGINIELQEPTWDPNTPLEVVSGSHFNDEPVYLDGRIYERCTFSNAHFLFEGRRPFIVRSGCIFNGQAAVEGPPAASVLARFLVELRTAASSKHVVRPDDDADSGPQLAP